MYHAEYIFNLDIVEESLKEMLEKMNMPYPVLKNAIKNTVISESKELFTQAQQKEFVDVCIKQFIGTKLDLFIVVGARYEGVKNCYKMEEK